MQHARSGVDAVVEQSALGAVRLCVPPVDEPAPAVGKRPGVGANIERRLRVPNAPQRVTCGIAALRFEERQPVSRSAYPYEVPAPPLRRLSKRGRLPDDSPAVLPDARVEAFSRTRAAAPAGSNGDNNQQGQTRDALLHAGIVTSLDGQAAAGVAIRGAA